MKEYSSSEIQKISLEFRGVARRLSRTDYDQCDSNLKRFMLCLENNELIKSYVDENNVVKYDIDEVKRNRDWLSPFEVSPIFREEFSLEIQLLKYATDKYNGDFTQLYGTYIYTKTKSNVSDEMRTFIDHIIDPLIDHIGDYLCDCLREAKEREEKKEMRNWPSIQAHNSQVFVSSPVEGNVTNEVNISEKTKEEAFEYIRSIKDIIEKEQSDSKEEIKELIELIEKAIIENKEPPKGLFTALRNITSGIINIIPILGKLKALFQK